MTGAILSPCGAYRYTLTRDIPQTVRWVRVAAFIMLNPSTADATQDDPTIRRCIGFAKAWGCTELRVVNLFAFRATDPANLANAADPVGPENDEHIVRATRDAGLIVAAWGSHKMAAVRECEVLGLISNLRGMGVRCLGTTKSGAPRHPLYVRAVVQHERFELPRRAV